MLARLGTVFYWCTLAIAFVCWIAALIILMAVSTGRLSDSGVWMAAVFFAYRRQEAHIVIDNMHQARHMPSTPLHITPSCCSNRCPWRKDTRRQEAVLTPTAICV
jgi:hypothetical protein